jgi:hypothetical protein
VAELIFSGINVILAKLTQGPAVMIGRPPPSAAPKSDHPLMTGRATPKWLVNNESAGVERAHPRYAAGELDTNVKKLETEDR